MPMRPLTIILNGSDKVAKAMAQEQGKPPQSTALNPNPQDAWFKPNLNPIPEPFRELLEHYAGIPSEQVEDHILKVRNALWRTHPYPCLGMGYFTRFDITRNPLYTIILELLATNLNAALLDLGTGLGHDLRKCAYDLSKYRNRPINYSPNSAIGKILFGIDISIEMLEGGAKMFQDKLQGIFIGNLAEEGVGEQAVEAWGGTRPSLAYVGKVFHMYGWEAQVKLAVGLVRLMLGPGVSFNVAANNRIVFGCQLGIELEEEAGLKQIGLQSSPMSFIHSRRTMKKFWKEVGEKTGTEWEVLTFEYPDLGQGVAAENGTREQDGCRLVQWGVKLVGRV